MAEFVFFWGHKPVDKIGKNCLSQWFPCKFKVDGIEYNCAEQYMMAEKARMFNDDETLALILAETDPRNIKALGRKVKNFDADLWSSKCRAIVYRGNLTKFMQNEDLKSYLLSTNEATLVEASPYDKIWGIGMLEHDKGVEDPKNWKGTNLLGKTLMTVRSTIMTAESIAEKMH